MIGGEVSSIYKMEQSVNIIIQEIHKNGIKY